MSADRHHVAHLVRARFWILAVATLVLAHDAVYVVHAGAGLLVGEPLDGTHGGWWLAASLAGLAGGAALAAAAVLRLLALSGAAGSGRRRRGPRTGYVAEVRALWPRLFIVTVAAFLILENVEHLVSEGQLPGLEVLIGGDHSLALPTLVGVTLGVAAMGALVRWKIRSLLSRLPSIRDLVCASAPNEAPGRWLVTAAIVTHQWLLWRGGDGRAPPSLLPATRN